MTTQAPVRTTPTAESLLVTGDESLAAFLAPLAAAAGHPLHRVAHVADAESRWQRAPLVIIGADAAASCVDHHLPRRRGLIICTGAPHTGPGDPTDTSALWPLAVRLDADHVVAVPEAGDWLLDRFSRTIRDATPAPVIATVAAHGGAGASTLALAAAATAAERGERVLLIDLDTRAGGIAQAAGLAAQPGWRWPSIGGGRGQIDPERLCAGLPQRTGLHILAPDARRPSSVAPEVVDRVLHAARAAADLVIVDLPRAAAPAAGRRGASSRSSRIFT
jgi:secretion/DNA translocation related CpaE-like protein